MIDTEALRKKIIILAIQGKLTEQLPEDGNASTLFAQIQDEKAKLVKEGRIKKEKPLHEISNDEIPFNIPDNWKWCRLGEVCKVLMGQSPDGANIGYDENGVEFHQGKIFFGDKYLNQSNQKTSELTRVTDADSVLLCVRAPIGIVNITEREICIGRGLCALKTLCDMPSEYLYYYLTICRKEFEKHGTGSTFSSITVNVVKNHVIPLPPLEEQKRIIEKVGKILTQIDTIDTLQKQYASDLEVLKEKIIDAGMRGYLTEQLSEDGNAEELYAQIQKEKARLIKEGKIRNEKHLPEISDDEIPYEIPNNWKWVRLFDVVDVRDGTHDTPRYIPSGYPLISGKDFYTGTFDFSKTQYISKADYDEIRKRSNVEVDDILFSMIGGNIGSMIKISKENYFEMAIKNVALFKQYSYEVSLSDYLFFYLRSQVNKFKYIAQGGAQSFVSLKILRMYLFPLPPFAEQKRIANKLNEIMSVISQQL